MTQEQFQQLIDSEVSRLNKGLEDVITQLKNKKPITINQRTTYMTVHNIRHDLSENMSFANFKETIKDFEIDCKPHKNKYEFKQRYDASAEDDSAFIELIASWYELKTKNSESFKSIALSYAKSELKKEIVSKLNLTERQAYNVFIDCKILKLWMDKTIDFDAFCTISTTNCKIS